MPDPDNAKDGEDILKSIRRLVSVEEEDAFRSDRPEDAPGDRLVLTEDMAAEGRDLPPLVLGGETAATQPEDEAAQDEARLELEELSPVAAGLDELALREMVAEIIREELRGELGERVTSNIRKLVRREILRAQSLRDTG